jgi:hypothetical protein
MMRFPVAEVNRPNATTEQTMPDSTVCRGRPRFVCAQPPLRYDLGLRKEQIVKNIVVTAVLSALIVSAPSYAAPGKIGPKRHPHLARAQREVETAYQSVVAAQTANEFDLGGHAAKAKELLQQVNKELKQAAEQSNDNKGH